MSWGRPHLSSLSQHEPDDAAVRARLRELAAMRRRFGYRRLLVLMAARG